MKNGWYRLVTKEGTDYDIVSVENGQVSTAKFLAYNGDPVEEFLEAGLTFTRVYPVDIGDELWEKVEEMAYSVGLPQDAVVREALSRFFNKEI